MIYGIGQDILEIERIASVLGKGHGGRFIRRILTPAELLIYEKRSAAQAEFAAGRFAAKEAVVKAFGSGIGTEIGFQDIEVLPDAKGKPVAALSEQAWKRLGLSGEQHTIHLTITHSRGMAAAFAVVEAQKS